MSRFKRVTSESVGSGHPDKVADYISDSLLDEYLKGDIYTHAGIETLVTTNKVIVAGEVKSSTEVDVDKVVRKAVAEIGYDLTKDVQFAAETLEVINLIHEQSPDIDQGVKQDLGAGDQGIIFGYATDETTSKLPLSQVLANDLVRTYDKFRKDLGTGYRPDSKSQVTLRYVDGVATEVESIIMAVSHCPLITLEAVRYEVKRRIIEQVFEKRGLSHLITPRTQIIVNGTGRFVICGPHSDVGLTGRKIVVDQYGGQAPVGGGAFCLPKYQIISTPNGDVRIGDISIGDEVLVEGVRAKVLNFFEAGIKKAYRLETDNGYTVDTSAEHFYKVVTSDGYIFKRASELTDLDYVVFDKEFGFGNTPIEDSYIIGYILGDGWLSASDNSINVKVPALDRGSRIYSEFDRLGGKVYEDVDKEREGEVMDKLYYCNKEYRERLETLGLSSCGALNKKVPSSYLTADKESVRELLRGLFDSDGTVHLSKGNRDTIKVSYRSSSIELIRGIQYLLLKFGIKSRITKTAPRETHIQGRLVISKESYCVVIQGKESLDSFIEEIGFCIDRKSVILADGQKALTDRTLIPGCIHKVASEYYNNSSFREYLRTGFDSIRKTVTLSGDASKRAIELTKNNIKDILSSDCISVELRDFLEERLTHNYERVVSSVCLGDEDMCDIEVEGVHVFTAQGFVVHNSGKDPSKVDRSAAYMARLIAKAIVSAGISQKVLVKMAYCIGHAEPTDFGIDTLGTSKSSFSDEEIASIIRGVVDLTPEGIRNRLDLRSPIYKSTTFYSHFGNPGHSWEDERSLSQELKSIFN